MEVGREKVAGLLALATVDLNALELEALRYVTEGMSVGARKFGNYSPGKRDLLEEAIEEARDMLVYLLFLKAERNVNQGQRRGRKTRKRK